MAASWEVMALARSFRICHVLNKINNKSGPKLCYRCLSAESEAPSPRRPVAGLGHGGAKKAEKISMAMKAYLERAKAHENFMQQEVTEYEIGKRHLANIMGADPDNFSQEDIDTAIQYLLPSGVFDKKSRPLMKHPLEIIPQKKDAQFDVMGRPYDSLFYTGFPNFYQVLHDCAVIFEELKQTEDEMKSKGMSPIIKLNLGGSQWVEKEAIEKKLSEPVSTRQYGQFISMLALVAEHPWAHRHKDFIMTYRKMLPMQLKEDSPEALISESGRPYQTAEGQRKTAIAKVTVWDQGSGQVNINGKDLLTYFPCMLDREQVMFPLQFTNKLGEVDFEATIESGGNSSQAGALRLALSRALQSLVDKSMVEKLRLAGLLTRDPRRKERKKFGQEGARKKFTWKKR